MATVAWDVWLSYPPPINRGSRLIDTVYYNESCDADDVKRDLIRDGYDPNIRVVCVGNVENES